MMGLRPTAEGDGAERSSFCVGLDEKNDRGVKVGRFTESSALDSRLRAVSPIEDARWVLPECPNAPVKTALPVFRSPTASSLGSACPRIGRPVPAI